MSVVVGRYASAYRCLEIVVGHLEAGQVDETKQNPKKFDSNSVSRSRGSTLSFEMGGRMRGVKLKISPVLRFGTYIHIHIYVHILRMHMATTLNRARSDSSCSSFAASPEQFTVGTLEGLKRRLATFASHITLTEVSGALGEYCSQPTSSSSRPD